MSLYEYLNCEERKINEAKKAIASLNKSLNEYGVSVRAELPEVKEIAKKLLESEEYSGNNVVQRMKASEPLQHITDNVVDQRRYGLKFDGQARKHYNKQVDEIAEVIPSARELKVHPIYSLNNPEALAAAFAAGGILIGQVLSYFVPEVADMSIGLLAGAGLVGSILLITRPSKSAIKSAMKSEIQYLNEKLGGRYVK